MSHITKNILIASLSLSSMSNLIIMWGMNKTNDQLYRLSLELMAEAENNAKQAREAKAQPSQKVDMRLLESL